MTQAFTYDTVMPGKLSNATITGGPTITYTYITAGNGVGNVKTKTWAGPRGAIGYTYTYDAYNRLATTTYPKLSNGAKSLVIRNTYSGGDIGGELTQVDDVTTSTTVNYWTLTFDGPERGRSRSQRCATTSRRRSAKTLPSGLAQHDRQQARSRRRSRACATPAKAAVAYASATISSHPTHRSPSCSTTTVVERLTNWSWSGAAGARGVAYIYDDIGNLQERNVTAGPGTS